MNKFFISIAFAAIFATAGLAVAGDKPDPPGAKKSLQRIRLPFDCDGKRDGVVMDSQVITRDPDNVKLGTKFDLTTTIRHKSLVGFTIAEHDEGLEILCLGRFR